MATEMALPPRMSCSIAHLKLAQRLAAEAGSPQWEAEALYQHALTLLDGNRDGTASANELLDRAPEAGSTSRRRGRQPAVGGGGSLPARAHPPGWQPRWHCLRE